MINATGLRSLLLSSTLIVSGSMAIGQEQPADFLTEEYRNNWGLFTVGAHFAYARGFTGRGVIIGIFDEPAQLDHSEFEGRVVSPDPFPLFPVPGFAIPFHGTHVMGIAAAARDGQGMMGVAFDASIVQLIGNEQPGYSTVDEQAVINQIIQSGTQVINVSQGYTTRPEPFLDQQRTIPNPNFAPITYLPLAVESILGEVPLFELLADADIVTVFSNGNNHNEAPEQAKIPSSSGFIPLITPQATSDGTLYRFIEGNNDTFDKYNPDNWTFVAPDDPRVANLDLSYLAGTSITVAALDYHNNGQIAPFSNRCGAAAAWCITAPGVDIYSTYPLDRYAVLSGTSMAAPMVAGGAALVRQAFPYMTARQVIEVILTTATDLGSPEIFGHGLLNLDRATRGPIELGSDPIFADIFAVNTAGHDSEWSNDISGTGGIAKDGAGVLRLSGQNTYTGATSVLGGVLQVDGSIAASELTVGADAVLMGRGTVGTTTLSGVVAPGNSVGQLTVNGDLALGANSVYDFEIDADLTSDLISVTGNVVIDAQAQFRVTTENGIDPSRTYTLLTAGGTVTGSFAGPAVPFTFLDLGTTATVNGLDLTASRNAVTMSDYATSLNQRAVAAALDTQPDGAQPRAIALANTDPGALPALYQGWSGEIYSSHQAVLMGETGAMGRVLSKRIATLNSPGGQAGVLGFAASPAGGPTAWAQGYGNWGRVDPSAAAAAMTFSSQGLVLGSDWELGNGLQLGAALGLTDHKSNSAGSQAKSKGYHLAFYGSGNVGAVVLGAGLLGSWYDTEVDRTMPAGVEPSANTNLSGTATQAFLEASLPIQAGPGYFFSPFAQLGQTWLHQRSFAEAGSAAALTGQSADASVGFAVLGARIERSWTANDTVWTLNASASWQRNWGDLSPATTLAFDTGDAFRVSAAPIAKDLFALELEIGAEIGGSARADFGYKADLARGMDRQSVTGSITWTF